MDSKNDDTVWFVYDGECPICQMGASMYKVREAVGKLTVVNARTEKNHWLMTRINEAGLDLDKGMVICFQDQLYHGDEALRIMAELGSGKGLYNRSNELLFKSAFLSKLLYPIIRGARNFLLRLRGVEKIRNLDGH